MHQAASAAGASAAASAPRELMSSLVVGVAQVDLDGLAGHPQLFGDLAVR
jgi:hypothetical protein